jgi:hypothetical protein
VDGTSPTFRLFGETPRTARVGVPFPLDLTLRHRHGSGPVVDRVQLVQVLDDDTKLDLAVADLGGLELDADDVLPGNDEVPVRLTWVPDDAQIGPVALQVRVAWRAYGYEDFASVDVPLALWVGVSAAP